MFDGGIHSIRSVEASGELIVMFPGGSIGTVQNDMENIVGLQNDNDFKIH